jgi:hypothetical protein
MSLHPDIERVALLGWHLYPASTRSKAGCFPGAADAASCNLEQLETWANAFGECNWRVVAGPSKLFILDVDRPGPTHDADGFAELLGLTERYGALPPRPMTRSGGSGGAALFFEHRGEPLRGASGSPRPGLDPHRGRQAIMIPPSRHPLTGGIYSWRVPPWECTPPPIPGWLAALLEPPPEPAYDTPYIPTHERARNAVMKAIHRVQDAASGAANDTLNRAAYSLGRWCGAGLVSTDESTQSLLFAAQKRGIPDREAKDTIKSGLAAGRRNPVEARYVGR